MTGIQKYAKEIVKRLDARIKPGEMEIAVPEWTDNMPSFQNLKVVRIGKNKGILWEQLDYALYLKMNGKQAVCFTNNIPVFSPRGVVVIHDICCKTRPEFYQTIRDKLSAKWHSFLYAVAAHSNMQIVTVSRFSKQEIMDIYKVPPDRIHVIYNAWQEE